MAAEYENDRSTKALPVEEMLAGMLAIEERFGVFSPLFAHAFSSLALQVLPDSFVISEPTFLVLVERVWTPPPRWEEANKRIRETHSFTDALKELAAQCSVLGRLYPRWRRTGGRPFNFFSRSLSYDEAVHVFSGLMNDRYGPTVDNRVAAPRALAWDGTATAGVSGQHGRKRVAEMTLEEYQKIRASLSRGRKRAELTKEARDSRNLQRKERRKERRANMTPYELEKEMEKERTYNREYMRTYWSKSRQTNLPHKKYSELFALQGGVCAICKRPPSNGKRLHLDHDHARGKDALRGLLCCNCNTRLVAALEATHIGAALAYLERHGNKDVVDGIADTYAVIFDGREGTGAG